MTHRPLQGPTNRASESPHPCFGLGGISSEARPYERRAERGPTAERGHGPGRKGERRRQRSAKTWHLRRPAPRPTPRHRRLMPARWPASRRSAEGRCSSRSRTACQPPMTPPPQGTPAVHPFAHPDSNSGRLARGQHGHPIRCRGPIPLPRRGVREGPAPGRVLLSFSKGPSCDSQAGARVASSIQPRTRNNDNDRGCSPGCIEPPPAPFGQHPIQCGSWRPSGESRGPEGTPDVRA
jgi:hypothetical protein